MRAATVADARRVLRPAGAFGVMLPRLMCTVRGENVIPVIEISVDVGPGVTVTVNGATVPLIYVSPGQINFQLPYETAPGTATATVNSGCGPSAGVSFPVASAAPYLLLGANSDAPANAVLIRRP